MNVILCTLLLMLIFLMTCNGLVISWTVDNQGAIYVDGKDITQSNRWSVTVQTNIPVTTQVVGFKAHDYGVIYGIVASYSNGWSTADVAYWKCTSDTMLITEKWSTSDYDDSGWETPHIVGTNNNHPSWQTRPHILRTAKWIWTRRYASLIYCRHNLYKQCGLPSIQQIPVIGYSIIEENERREVEMTCTIIPLNDANVVYDVEWYTNDRRILTSNGLETEDFPVKLHEKDLTINSELKCVVYPRYNSSQKRGCKTEATYFIGFEISPDKLTTVEGEASVKLEVRPTIPILCPFGKEDCELVLNPVELTDAEKPAVCNDGTPMKQIAYNTAKCGITIGMTTNTSTKYSIEMTAATDGIYDGDHDLNLIFQTPSKHAFHSLWEGCSLPLFQVKIKDRDAFIAGKVCSAVNDPHMTTFDGRRYEHQLEGEFLLYKHKTLPIHVQAYFKRCPSPWNKATCVCGAAVRSAGDLFIYDHCRNLRGSRIRLYECEEGGIEVEELPPVNAYRLYLPTGAKIELYKNRINIYPSVTDIDNTEGLCGTLNNNCNDDFLLPNGLYNPVDGGVCHSSWRFYPLEFSKSWRVNPDESLYKGKLPEQKLSPPNNVYCSCQENTKTNQYETKCGSMGEAAVQVCATKNKVKTSRLKERCLNRRQRAATIDDDEEEDIKMFQYNDTYVAPFPTWSSSWTEESARIYCSNYISNKPATQTCINQHVGNVDEAIESCVADIQLTGDTKFSDVHLSAVLSKCSIEITKNMTYYSYDNEISPESGNMSTILKTPVFLLADVCPENCNEHGLCIKGECNCHSNYTGEDCSQEKNKVPILFDLPNKGLCDKQQRPCQMSAITGDYFIDRENLTCQVQSFYVLTNGDLEIISSVNTKAEYVHWQRVLCVLPVINVIPEKGITSLVNQISVSNDGEDFSESVKMTIYDSRCITCPLPISCQLKEDKCYISGVCYEAGYHTTEKKCCIPYIGQTEWTDEDNCRGSGTMRKEPTAAIIHLFMSFILVILLI